MREPDDLDLKILTALATNPERLGRFIDLTGIQINTIREASLKPEFWLAIYEYVAADEPLLLEISSEINETPEIIMQAWKRLLPPESFEYS